MTIYKKSGASILDKCGSRNTYIMPIRTGLQIHKSEKHIPFLVVLKSDLLKISRAWKNEQFLRAFELKQRVSCAKELTMYRFTQNQCDELRKPQ